VLTTAHCTLTVQCIHNYLGCVFAGANGRDGADGWPGVDGLDGPQGATGPRGPAGFDGTLITVSFAAE